jgi:hypothetical protein
MTAVLDAPTVPPPTPRPTPSPRADRRVLVDLLFAAVLSSLAVIGFDSSFGGNEAYVVGVPAVACGLAVGYLLVRWRPPMLVGAAASTVAFLLLGGAVALRKEATAGLLPNGDVIHGLADGAINGWSRLLTSVPPAGQAGHLLTIPYLVGFAGALLAVVVAAAFPRWPICVAPPAGVLALAVLFGTERPASRLLQGAVFGAVTVAWICLRADRRDRPQVVHGSRQRLVGGIALLVVAIVGALAVGPHLPFAKTEGRYILRDRVQPPFDPSQYPSPLTRFRLFHGEDDDELKGGLLTVRGLPSGEVVRFAVMDSYDGYVWRASPPNTDLGGAYLRVGDEIPGANEEGTKATVRFQMGSIHATDSVWIPTAGSPTSIRFEGEHADDLTEEFRFDRKVEAAASPLALREGDEWVVDTVFADPPSEDLLRGLSVGGDAPQVPELPESVQQRLVEWTKDVESPYEKAQAIARNLRDAGAYNDGSREPRVPSGHSLARLIPFLDAKQPNGNGEQYASVVAYALDAIGIPARVVLEMVNTEGADPWVVQASDVRAVVEIYLQTAGWVQIDDPTPEESKEPDPQVTTPPEKPTNEVQPPPPTTVPPPARLPTEPDPREADKEVSTGSSGIGAMVQAVVWLVRLAAVPVTLLLVPGLLVIGFKARRRKARRTQGAPADRVAAAWAEVADLARDLGQPVPPQATRREIARFAELADIEGFALRVDSSVFGRPDPDDASASAAWTQVDELRRSALDALPTVERIRTMTSLSSIRGVRRGATT